MTDPFDNVIDYHYDSVTSRLVKIEYPSGIDELWDWDPQNPAPNGWAGHSFIRVSYYDRLASVDLPSGTLLSGTKWGMVFENVGSSTHFHGRIKRIYKPETRYVEPDSSFGGFYDLDASQDPVQIARPMFDFGYTDSRISSLKEARFWGDLLDDISISDPATSLEEYLAITYWPNGRVKSHIHTQLGRGCTYAYGQVATRVTDVPGTLSRTTRTDSDGHQVHFEFYPPTGRVYRTEIEPVDNADGRPRSHDAENASLGANAVDEPSLIRIDKYFDATCVCARPTKIVWTGFDGASVIDQRQIEYAYNPDRLLWKVIEPNPSTASGAPSTVETVYTYVSAPSTNWSAKLIESVTTPDGVFEYDYVWRNRANLTLHGKMPEQISRSIDGVRLQTDLGSTSTTKVEWTAHLGFAGYPANHVPGITNGKSAIVVDGDGVTTQFSYDPYGRLDTVKAGDVTTDVNSDAWGRVSQVEINSTAASSLSAVIAIEQGLYGETFSASTTVDGVPIATQMAYDRWGNLVVVRKKNKSSTGQTPTNGREWAEDQFHYQWHEIQEAYTDRRPLDQPRGAPFVDSPIAWFLKTEYEYALNGRLKSIRHPNGAKTTYVIDGFGSFYTAKTASDPEDSEQFQHAKVFVNGLLEPVAYFEGAAGSGNPKLWTLLHRNAAGAVTIVTEPAMQSGLAPAGYSGSLGGAIRQLELDELGRVVEELVGDGTTTFVDVERTYDQLGRLMREEQHAIRANGTPISGESAIRAWRYAAGRESQLEFVRRKAGSGNDTETYSYDSTSGRLTYVEDDVGNRTTFEYHALTDHVKAVTRRLKDGQNGNQNVDYRSEYLVDALGRVKEVHEKGTTSTALVHAFAYNSFGHTDHYTDPLQKSQTFLTDALGRLARHVRLGSSTNPTTLTVHDDYLSAGWSGVRRYDGRGHATETHFDYLGRPVAQRLPGSTTMPTSGSPHQAHAYFAKYDVLSRLSELYDGDGGRTRFWYDSAGRLIARESTNAHQLNAISNYNARDLINRDVVGRSVNSASFAVDGSGA
ncbi:MAG: hypothetical protein GX610_11510, partial [Rhodococcus sp.]|nr:hypothetical protein [Rhodococcus sp. (in: high G+C Gram-positive bacteria)]